MQKNTLLLLTSCYNIGSMTRRGKQKVRCFNIILFLRHLYLKPNYLSFHSIIVFASISFFYGLFIFYIYFYLYLYLLLYLFLFLYLCLFLYFYLYLFIYLFILYSSHILFEFKNSRYRSRLFMYIWNVHHLYSGLCLY